MLADAPVDTTTYLLEQRFRYEYESPVRRLRNRLLVVPRTVHGGQYRFDHGLTVSEPGARVAVSSDSFGNHVVDIRVDAVNEWIEFDAWARVGRRGEGGVTALSLATARDDRLRTSSALTRADPVLADAAQEIASSGARGLDLAERACAWTNQVMSYGWGVTGVRTTAAEAVAGRQGVCQDYAHIMLALCRSAGLPARYVSGHLVGEGGSHAWVEVVVEEASATNVGHMVAVAFDPTHDRRADRGYITVAVGRDYADVAPTSGSFAGDCAGVLSGSKRLTTSAAPPITP